MIIKKHVFSLSLLFLLFFYSMNSYAQSVTITGSVRSVAGDGLYGVSIVEVGTTNTTITNKEGGFAIQVASASKLSFSYAGYKTSIVDIQGQMNLQVVLEEEERTIDEATIGYGSLRNAMATGSVVTIYGDELREVPASNITQALQGRVAGLQLSQTSTKPGTSMQMRIRGTHSANNTNDPLIILDGVPFSGNISDISIDDIKRIDILKDADVAAIYGGSNGGNGVILITTNKGVKGQKMQLTYNGYCGLETAIEYPMMNAAEFMKLRTIAGRFTNGEDESDHVDTDWQGLFYRTGMVNNHDIGLSGGTKKGNYKLHVGYYTDKAVVPGLDYSRLSLRGAFEQEIGSYLRLGFSTNSNYNVNNGEGLGVFGVLTMSPIADPFVRDAQGNITSTKRFVRQATDNIPVITRDIINNLGDQWIDQTQGYGSYNSFYGEVKIPGIKGLKYTVNLGLNHRNSITEKYTGVGVFSDDEHYPAHKSHGESRNFSQTIDHQLSYDRVFSQKHRLNAMLLYSSEKTKYSKNENTYINLAPGSADSSFITSGYRSVAGRVMYSFDDRYMISATVRSDASLRSAATYYEQTSPSVAMGWDIRKASFMKHASSIDVLKLRVGYGQRDLTLGSETVVTKNAGLDFSFFKGRLSGAAEYYVMNSKEVIMMPNLVGGTGSVIRQIDGASIRNQGMELTLKAIVLKNMNGWSWDVGVNLYTNKNKLEALPMGQTKDMANCLFVGHPLNIIYDYKKTGLWNKTDADYKYMSILEPQGNVGMIKVEYTGATDETGKPVRAIGEQDRQIIDCDPDFMGGINSRLAYKGFDLVIVGVFQSGGILNSTLYGTGSYLNMNSGRRGQIKTDYWTPDHTNAKYPAPGGVASGDQPKYGSTTGYFNASYLKINTITFGYNFTSEWLKTAGFEKLRLYGTLQYPFVLFSPYYNETGLDPQTNSYANDSANNVMPSTINRFLVAGANTPSTKNFIIGVNVTL